MLLTVKNLGRIREAQIEIKPLTVFVGPNNTNKTWTAYCLYELLSRFTTWHVGAAHSRAALSQSARIIEFAQSLAAECRGRKEIIQRSLSELAFDQMEAEIDDEAIASILAVNRDSVARASAELSLEGSRRRLELTSGRVTLDRHNGEAVRIRFSFDHDAKGFEYTAALTNLEASLIGVLDEIVSECFPMVLPIPAERKLLTSVFRVIPSLERTGSRLLPRPAWDFAAALNLASGLPDSADRELESLRRSLAQDIIEGRIDLTDTSGIGIQGEHPYLPIHAASSVARALAGVSIYLQKLADAGDALVIDEPEMNAHPEAQIAITEFLAILVNAGINVVFTTHSSYVLEHLNNLLDGTLIPQEDVPAVRESLALKSEKAFLDPSKVAAYLFTPEGEVQDIYDPRFRTIDTSTFSDVSNRVGRIYSEILKHTPSLRSMVAE